MQYLEAPFSLLSSYTASRYLPQGFMSQTLRVLRPESSYPYHLNQAQPHQFPGRRHPETAQPAAFRSQQQPDSPPAWHTVSLLSPGRSSQFSSPATSSLQAQCSQTAFFRPGGNQTALQSGTQSVFNPGRNQPALWPSNQQLSSPAYPGSIPARPTNP